MDLERMANYHSHKYYTNPIYRDSPTSYDQYIDRCIELGQRVITSVEHGFQGNYWLLNELIENKNKEFEKRRNNGEQNVPEDLIFVFGTEAYWVKDRHEKDRSNCHIVILAKNENGRRKINLALSKANEDGMFGGRPRIDLELLFELPKDDVFITSACVGYWNKYNDIEEITLKLHKYFGNNFMLEVQNHNTEKQKILNKRILELSKRHGIQIIVGLDSHYIKDDKNGKLMRDRILEDQNIVYGDEEGWFMDYPSVLETYERFINQGILTSEEIQIGIRNTLIIEEFGKYNMNRDIKLPTLYKDKSQEWKDNHLKQIINKEWKNFREKENIPKEEYEMYLDGIRYETGEVIKTGMADYFLDHYYGLKLGVEKGGKITKRGRGSAVSYFINTLLGFSKVDRFKAPIKLYPERFLTADRIIKSRSLPDIDNNIDSQEPFVEAFRELLGEYSIYPMLAFGSLKKSSAIKLYMRTEDIDATIQNEVTKQLKEYDRAIKHCETEEEKEEIKIEDYISKEYVKYVELSKPYQGIIVSKSPHPCAHLILNDDIREDIGLLRCESKSKGTSVLTACIEGTMADHYKYLKTDLLIVDVVGLTEAIWERIGEESPSNSKLEELLKTKNGEKAWDVYEKGNTLCINQCEQDGTRGKCKRYKMKNTAELSSFCSAVRPGFASQINNFLDRKSYTNGVKELDELFSDSQKYILFQENIMGFLSWLGIEMKDTYDIVKKISKKVYTDHPEQMEELKNRCRPMWIKNVGTEEGFDKIFKVVELSGAYIFNASHAYCVGNDGVEIAYCKGNYPYETYEVCLNWFDKKKKKNKVALLKQEMKNYGISEGKLKYGLDNRAFTLDKENHCVNPSLSCIKAIGENLAEELYLLSQQIKYDNFFELLKDIKIKTSCNSKQLDTLIKLDYFDSFGKSQKLLDIVEIYNTIYTKKQFKKDKLPKFLSLEILRMYANSETEKQAKDINMDELILYLISTIKDKNISLKSLLDVQKEYLGYIDYKNQLLDKRYVLVSDINTKYTPVINTYCLNSGISIKCKISKPVFRGSPLNENDIIYIHSMKKKYGCKKVGEKTLKNGSIKPIFEEDKSTIVWWIDEYSKIDNLDEILEDIENEAN